MSFFLSLQIPIVSISNGTHRHRRATRYYSTLNVSTNVQRANDIGITAKTHASIHKLSVEQGGGRGWFEIVVRGEARGDGCHNSSPSYRHRLGFPADLRLASATRYVYSPVRQVNCARRTTPVATRSVNKLDANKLGPVVPRTARCDGETNSLDAISFDATCSL